jgi:L-iditol 2-dehydrogenase
MRASLLLSPKHIEIRDIAQPEAAAGEVLIQPLRAGICGSDLSCYLGHRPVAYPFVLGHELVGRVVGAADGVTKFAMGQRVVVEPNYPCGTCSFCRSGRGRICPNKLCTGLTVPGCFADRIAVPAEFVWAVPDSINDVDAASIEPLTVSLHAMLQSGARLGDTVAVVGCGVVGLLLIHVANRMGVRVLAHDKVEAKLAWARKLGAETPAVDNVAECWLREDVTTVFECAGVTPTVELALAAAPRGSQVMLLGLSNSPASFVPLHLVREGIRIEPSMIYDHPADFARAIRLVASATLIPSLVVGESFPLEQTGSALDLACTGQSGKIQIVL